MTDIAIVYNFAEHPGGGDLVALDITEALLEKGYNVHIYTSMPKGIWKAVEYFGKNPKTFEDVVIKKVEVPRLVKHPYNIYLITKKALNELKKYNLVVFFDDISKQAQELKKVLVYVHYPHAARILLNELVPYRYKYTLKGRITWKIHSVLFKTYFLMNWNKPNIYAITNSTLTYQHVSKSLKPAYLIKMYPPVQAEQIINYLKKNNTNKEKGNIAIYVGRIQPEKGIEDIIKAAALIKDIGIKIKIIGFLFDNRYLKHLKILSKELEVAKQVEIVPNASRKKVIEALANAKMIIHPAYYEPFGMAVVEGMATGCIPIVRKGINGPWIDVLDRGKYGLGFKTVEELAKAINHIINNYKTINVKSLISKALEFSETTFKRTFLKIINKIN